MPTLRELNLKPGDVAINNGTRFRVTEIGAEVAYGEVLWSDGSVMRKDGFLLDVNSAWQIENRSDPEAKDEVMTKEKHKPWNEMTDEEKAPILLAWARGEEIEWYNDHGKWLPEAHDPRGWVCLTRRIKPKPEAPKRVEALIHWGSHGIIKCRDEKDAEALVWACAGHVYRITRNEDGSDPQIEKVEV